MKFIDRVMKRLEGKGLSLEQACMIETIMNEEYRREDDDHL